MIESIKTVQCEKEFVNNEKKQEQKNISQIRREVAQKIIDIIHKDDFESEEERMRFQAKIESKIKSGAKLSAKEMNYLRKYNPYLYHQMLRVQQKRESLKEQLKHCRTKQEVQQAISFAFSSIGEKDPAREAMVAAVENVSKQFCSSAAYERLPNTEEELKKNKKVEKSVANPFKDTPWLSPHWKPKDSPFRKTYYNITT